MDNQDSENRICQLCGRIMIDGPSIDKHHLIPKVKGGKNTDPVTIHKICHQKIHSLFSEAELKNYYHTFRRLCEHSGIEKFIKWVSKKEPEFYDSSKLSKRRKRR